MALFVIFLRTSPLINQTLPPPVSRARKLVIPVFILTDICQATDDGAKKVVLLADGKEIVFYERPKSSHIPLCTGITALRDEARYNLYPIVLKASGLPWTEACNYILSRLEKSIRPSISTYDGMADDLVAYRRFIDDEGINWKIFPAQKLNRPTYRYNNYLRNSVAVGALAASSAKRRMSAIIAFYSWLKTEKILIPTNPAWKESDIFINLTDGFGLEYSKRVTTTDVSIRTTKQYDPYDGGIIDGGKLRPLSLKEQEWIVEALVKSKNTEMILIHLLALLTGARIQTVLTFRVRHVRKIPEKSFNDGVGSEIRLPIGLGTGIDTKRDKTMSLHLPSWLFSMLQTYSLSERAIRRRTLSINGDNEEQYLFLSKFGNPFYSSKDENLTFNSDSTRRQIIKGQSVRKFMSEVIIPSIQADHDETFRYQFHDLRASFGMNLTDKQLQLVVQKKRTLHQVREFVKVRMGHQSAATTDRYLQYRGNMTHVLQVTDDHDSYLRSLAVKAGLL